MTMLTCFALAQAFRYSKDMSLLNIVCIAGALGWFVRFIATTLAVSCLH